MCWISLRTPCFLAFKVHLQYVPWWVVITGERSTSLIKCHISRVNLTPLPPISNINKVQLISSFLYMSPAQTEHVSTLPVSTTSFLLPWLLIKVMLTRQDTAWYRAAHWTAWLKKKQKKNERDTHRWSVSMSSDSDHHHFFFLFATIKKKSDGQENGSWNETTLNNNNNGKTSCLPAKTVTSINLEWQ